MLRPSSCHSGQEGQRAFFDFSVVDIKVFWSSHAALTPVRAVNKAAVALCLTNFIPKLLS